MPSKGGWTALHGLQVVHLDLCCFVRQLVSRIHRDAVSLGFDFAVVSVDNGRDKATFTCISHDADLPSSEWRGTVQDPWQRPRRWLLLVGNESLLQAAVLQQTTQQMQKMDLHRYREAPRLVLPHLAVLTALLESPSWLLLASLHC